MVTPLIPRATHVHCRVPGCTWYGRAGTRDEGARLYELHYSLWHTDETTDGDAA